MHSLGCPPYPTAGWEAITLWNHALFPYGAGDPWVTLAAVATMTRTLKLCTDVSPLPRDSPHVLAHTLIALDILSQGRVILGAGVDFDFTPVDPTTAPRRRAEILDESLDILTHLLACESVTHHGTHFSLDNVAKKRSYSIVLNLTCRARYSRLRMVMSPA